MSSVGEGEKEGKKREREIEKEERRDMYIQRSKIKYNGKRDRDRKEGKRYIYDIPRRVLRCITCCTMPKVE